ncbi:uncharacterized protein LOC114350001 [Ostrinia furnacalis]|uniref:uncharacterized protein LOC114350001 n=1 Tax=Ostrinia furnacalis TaxID=93504 RepID=UPI00103AE837|nr:uncharacterized protein LOC114350001 [Ostrinia furnacalis]
MFIAGDLSSVEITALDVRASGSSGVLLLISAVNVARSPESRLAIAHISVEDPANPRVTSLVPLRSWAQDAEQPPPRFLPLGPHALLYTPTYLALVSSECTVVRYSECHISGGAGQPARDVTGASGAGRRTRTSSSHLLSTRCDLSSVEITALDVRASGSEGILMLISAVNVARSPESRLAIGAYDNSIFS